MARSSRRSHVDLEEDFQGRIAVVGDMEVGDVCVLLDDICIITPEGRGRLESMCIKGSVIALVEFDIGNPLFVHLSTLRAFEQAVVLKDHATAPCRRCDITVNFSWV